MQLFVTGSGFPPCVLGAEFLRLNLSSAQEVKLNVTSRYFERRPTVLLDVTGQADVLSHHNKNDNKHCAWCLADVVRQHGQKV